MIRLSALNDDSSDESEPERTQESIKQAQEAEALELYNKALGYQHSEDYTKAEETYNLLLSSDFIRQAPTPEEDEGLNHPGQVLKYSAYKNLAVLAENKGEYQKSTDAYLEAVLLDDSDVTVWYHIGKVSMKSFNLTLARQAFEEGLKCNSKHWPCLDELCSVLYAIGDYARIHWKIMSLTGIMLEYWIRMTTCLVMIASALERDENYLKGLALRDKIFKEEAYLKRDYKHLRNLFLSFIDEEDEMEASKYVKEALKLREERLKLIEADKADPPPLDPVKPLTSYTWASLGECFVVLYDHLTSPDNPQSLGRPVNLDDYYKAIVTPDISMPHKASLAKAAAAAAAAAATADSLATSSFSTEGFGVYKSTGSSDNDEKIKKVTKRKKPPSNGLENEFPPKRRSARVRTSKKKEEDINYKDLIQSFMPFPLRSIILAEDESSQDSLNYDSQSNIQRGSQLMSQDGKALDKSSFGQSSEYDDVISGEAETLDVLTFVKDHMTNSGIIDLMVKFGVRLAAQRNKKWPSALADVFLKVYSRLRKHVILPSEFVRDQDEAYTADLAKLILVATELTLDKLLTAKAKSSSSLSPASSPRGGATGVSPIHVGPGISNKFLATDVEYLHCIALDKTIHGDQWLEMAIRVNWAKARYLMLQGQMEIAMLYLDRCTKLLAVEVSPLAEPITVKLVNCKTDNNITLEHVHKKLESLQRCQSLEEVHRLYELGHYEDVVQLLIPTLHQPQPKTKTSDLGMSIPERPAQLLLLQDSLIKLKDYKKCLECTEVALNEAVSQMSPCEAWSTTLLRLFQCVNTCIDESKSILDGFSQVKLQSLTLNIIKVIEASIYSSDVSMEPPLATAFPWVLLCKIIQSKENDEEMELDPILKPSTPVPSSVASPVPSVGGISDNNDAIASSSDAPTGSRILRFLRTAHDHLGRRGWCCNNDGTFLLLCVDLLREQLSKPNVSSREDLVRDLEQCFLCLYGHPSKKAKLRGLQEHNSCQIPLTWRNSAVVFDYFKPPELPTFDSKTNTVSTEVQNLMRRITLVVPQQELGAISFDNVQAFMEGTNDEVPKLPENLASVKRPVVTELFYLLADFYFKNKEFSKALKFYTHDICVQPNRSDSWAAMALIRKSRLESKLNACEPKSEGPIQKHAVAALRCFKRAMETDSTNSSILEEYGSLCYFLHSHASRQLKQFDEEESSLDTRSSLSQRKQDMLVLSEEIFTTALGMDDSEAWLHHYMLGKIAEKLGKAPEIYLDHYEKSSKHLDEDIATYPRKIPFYSPPDHVLEALEVYYRLHVSVLKLLFNEFPDVDKIVLEKHLQRAAKGPFFNPEYDMDGGHSIAFRTESTTSETSAIEPEKEVFSESYSEIRSSAKIEPSTVPECHSALPEATQVTSDTQYDVGKEKSSSTKEVSNDSDDVVSDSPSQGRIQKDTIRLEEPSVGTSAMETEEEGAGDTSKLSLERPTDDEKHQQTSSEDIHVQGSLISETEEASSSKAQETAQEDMGNIIIENEDISDKPPVNAHDKESSEDLVQSDTASESIQQEEEKMVVEEEEMTVVASHVTDVKRSETEGDDTAESKNSHIKEASEETSRKGDVESCEELDTHVKDKTETSENQNIRAELAKDTVRISKERPHHPQDLDMEKPVCSLGGSQESYEKQVVEETEDKDFDNEQQIGKEEISKDFFKETEKPSKEESESVANSSKVSPRDNAIQELDVPMDAKETSEEQDDKMETQLKHPKEPSDESTNKADTDEKPTPLVSMEICENQPEPEDSKEVLPMDTTTESVEKIHDPGVEKEIPVETSNIAATAEKANDAESGGPLETGSKEEASVKESEKSCEGIPDVAGESTNKSTENDAQTQTMVKESSSDKKESSTTNQCTLAPSIVKEKKPLTDEEKGVHRELIDVCIHGLEHCLLRFPQHHKSRYRLAYVYYVSPYHKDLQLSRALLLGENTGKTKLQRNPHQGLFNEKSKTNMFSAFWRIPEEDIDRPGSFCTHTQKSVELLLQVLRDVSEWDSLTNISNLLHRTPEPGKKYLRDNERHFLAKKACDFSVDIMTRRVESQDSQVEPAVLSQLVFDAYECWKMAQKYEGTTKISESLLVKAFEMYRAKAPDSPDVQGSGEQQVSVLEKAIRFCQQSSRPQTSSTSTTAPQTPADSSVDSQIDTAFGSDDIAMSEPTNEVSKKPLLGDQSGTTSLQIEAKMGNVISGEAPKEREIEGMAIKNTTDSGLSLSVPSVPLKAICSTIVTSDSRRDSFETIKESNVAKDACIAKTSEEPSRKDAYSDMLAEHSSCNRQQSEITLGIKKTVSDDPPEADISPSGERPSDSDKRSSGTQQPIYLSKLADLKCSNSEGLSSCTGKSSDSTSAFGECSESEGLSSLMEKSSDSPLVGKTDQESTLSLDEGLSRGEPASLDEQQ